LGKGGDDEKARKKKGKEREEKKGLVEAQNAGCKRLGKKKSHLKKANKPLSFQKSGAAWVKE